jgi:hypothetical protein
MGSVYFAKVSLWLGIALCLWSQAGMAASNGGGQTHGTRSSPPPIPYEDHGACPFECCAYRSWTANSLTPILTDRRKGSPVAFQVHEREQVQGVTGVVVTLKAGRAEVFKQTELGAKKLKVKPGDVIYILNYIGIGQWKFWFKGKVDSDFIADVNDSESDSELDMRIRAHPDVEWWVKIRNSRGQVGWSGQPDHFDDMNACGASSDTKLYPNEKEYLGREDAFRVLFSVKEIPATVLLKFAEIAKDPALRIANPGEEIPTTDVIRENGPPRRRLIFGGISKEYCLIHYERGGYSHTFHTMLFKLSEKDARFLWGVTSKRIKDLAEFRELLKGGVLDKRLPFAW